MARLCGRPGCSEVGAVAYGMVPEDLVFWLAPFDVASVTDASVLCQRHADAMVVPRGWTLDDRREDVLRLFRPRTVTPATSSRRARPRQRTSAVGSRGEQLQIDGTGEIERPADDRLDATAAADAESATSVADTAWEPDFDHADDLGGLLEVTSPLLARAFRGTDRPKR